jgi:hypothetical protein
VTPGEVLAPDSESLSVSQRVSSGGALEESA